jgi:deoxyribodipyrimidine photo-lyase
MDWRRGETHFMRNLVDGDFASNNGGWQWSASVGTDAVPYFRVFNPLRQSERFDPNGAYIRKFVPELAELSDKAIHLPHDRAPEQAAQAGYPQALVDLKASRQRAIAMFKEHRAGSVG